MRGSDVRVYHGFVKDTGGKGVATGIPGTRGRPTSACRKQRWPMNRLFMRRTGQTRKRVLLTETCDSGIKRRAFHLGLAVAIARSFAGNANSCRCAGDCSGGRVMPLLSSNRRGDVCAEGSRVFKVFRQTAANETDSTTEAQKDVRRK